MTARPYGDVGTLAKERKVPIKVEPKVFFAVSDGKEIMGRRTTYYCFEIADTICTIILFILE